MSKAGPMLPMSGLGSGRITVGLVAVFVFLAGCAFSAAYYVDSLITAWNRGVSGTVTVQLPPASDRTAVDARIEKATTALKANPNVASATVVGRDQVATLLKPWLIDDGLIADLPLPILIDVEMKSATPEALKSVGSVVARAVPGAAVDDHRAWLNRVVDLADGFKYLASAVFGLITAALSLTVVFATRAGLAEASQIVEVLHLVGSRDGTIAAQFARRAARQCLTGGVYGIVTFAPALGLVVWLAGRIDDGILPPVEIPWTYWAGLALLPLAATALSAATAHVTVQRSLKKLV